MSDLASPRSMNIGSPRRRSQKYQISFPSFGFAARWAENLRCSAQTPVILDVCDFGCLQNMTVNGKDYPIYSGK